MILNYIVGQIGISDKTVYLPTSVNKKISSVPDLCVFNKK